MSNNELKFYAGKYVFHRYATEQDICPNCKVDLSGEYIWDHFFKKEGSEEEATRIAEMYGASKDNGKFSRKIGLYDWGEDRTVAWKCPDCDHIWKRVGWTR